MATTLKHEDPNAVIFSKAIEIWRIDRQPAAKTYDFTVRIFLLLTRETGCETFQDVTRQRLLDWKEDIINRASRTTWNTYYRHLRAIGNCAVQVGLIETNPFLQVSGVKEYSRLPKTISEENMAAAIDVIHQYKASRLPWFWLAVTRFLYYHGIRRKQLVRIKWDDIHFENEIVVLRAEASKNKTERYIPLHKCCIDDLHQLESKCKPIVGSDLTGQQVFNVTLFSTRYFGTEMSCEQVTGFYQRLYKEHGIRIGAHRLRHTMATKLGTTGNIRVLQEMLGHKNILTTQRYVHVDISHLRTLASTLPKSI